MDNSEKIFLELEDEALDKLLAADKGEKGLCVGRVKAEGGDIRAGEKDVNEPRVEHYQDVSASLQGGISSAAGKTEQESCPGQIKSEGVKIPPTGNKSTPIVKKKILFSETSIIVIGGGAGTGKTTLALQIASKVAKEKVKNSANQDAEIEDQQWGVIFLGLEQSEDSLRNVVKSFGFGGEGMFLEQTDSSGDEPNKVRFCRLSPLPLSEQQADATFETRFAELQHMVLKQSGIEKYNSFFVIDSLNAFTGHPLTRSQLYQLFTLFRAQKIPLIVTLEQPEEIYSGGTSEIETACFLADIVIKLTREPGAGYLQFFMEISKSRVCRQGLGKHLYKTRTVKNAEEVGAPNAQHRTGLVVYPSVHFNISQARGESDAGPKQTFTIAEELHDEKRLDLENPVSSPVCFALQGPAGTHKLALGLNLGISYVEEIQDDPQKQKLLKAKLLVVTFGGQGEIDFSGVAWLKSQKYLSGLHRQDSSVTQSGGTKQTLVTYAIDNSDTEANKLATKSAEVTVLTFQIGVLTPEECIYRINKVLEDQVKAKVPFYSVLVSDTAELCTGFPLLSKDPMFFTALLDLFETKGLLTVGLGVLSSESPYLREINLALMAKATHRMKFEHYPKVEDLMKGVVEREHKDGRENKQSEALTIEQHDAEAAAKKSLERPLLTEQLVSVVIDNVTGKNYKRQPKWISVKGDKPKILECSPFLEPKIE